MNITRRQLLTGAAAVAVSRVIGKPVPFAAKAAKQPGRKSVTHVSFDGGVSWVSCVPMVRHARWELVQERQA